MRVTAQSVSLVEQTVILCRGGEIDVEQLPAVFSNIHRPDEPPPASSGSLTKENLTELLMRHNGNRSQVARELGVDRTTLWRWMKRLGLDK